MNMSLRRISRSRLFALLALLLAPAAAIRAAHLAPSPQQTTIAGGHFRVAGTIVSSLSGAPLARARVSLTSTRDARQSLQIVTGDDGRFDFTGIPAGKFSLRGAKRGFVAAAYEQHEQFSTAIVTGAGFDTENLVLRLTPLAFISGKVTGEVGDPVHHAQVWLYRNITTGGFTRVNRVSADSTDDQGYYEFPAVPPGEYFISASGRPWYAVHPAHAAPEGAAVNPPPNVAPSLDVAYPATYYSGATNSEGATPIAIKAGDHAQIDLHLNPVPALHLIVHVDEQQQGGYSMPTFRRHSFDSTEWVSSNFTQRISPGVFEVTGVPAGRYTVSQLQQGSQQSSEIVLSEDAQDVDVSHGELSARVIVKAVLPPSEKPPRQLFIALRNPRRQFAGNGAVDASGEIAFDIVPPGKYSIVAGSTDRPYSVSRVSAAGTADTAGPIIDVAAGASLDLTVYLVGGTVSLEGVVKRGDKPASGIMVALIPSAPESHLELFRRDQSDLDGTFILRGVIPGSYTLVAVEDAWGFAWLEPGALARYLRNGQNITISDPMRGSITLPEPVQVQPR